MAVKKEFKGTPEQMLTIIGTVGENLSDFLPNFQKAKTSFTEEYRIAFIGRVNATKNAHLGVDIYKLQRDATTNLVDDVELAYDDLSLLKLLIEEEMTNDADEILKQVGFVGENYKKAQKKNQVAMTKVLNAFKLGLTDDLKKRFSDLDFNMEIIDRLLVFDGTVLPKNTMQESLKSTPTTISDDAMIAYNKIYNEGKSICKYAPKVIKDAKIAQQKFSYNYLLNQLTGGGNNENVVDDDTTSEE